MTTPITLFAACRSKAGLTPKLVSLTRDAQVDIQKMFADQEKSFLPPEVEEIPFDGHYKPEKGELLTLDNPAEVEPLVTAVSGNATRFEQLTPANFDPVEIAALFTSSNTPDTQRVLVQRFTARQMLTKSSRLTILAAGSNFRRLDDRIFTFENSLTCVIEQGKIKFQSQHKLRSIISLKEVIRQATETEMMTFANESIFHLPNMEAFLAINDHSVRKMVYDVIKSEILSKKTLDEIKSAAEGTHLDINIQDGKIVLPAKAKDLKQLLKLLTDHRFTGRMSGNTYETNSRRQVVESA